MPAGTGMGQAGKVMMDVAGDGGDNGLAEERQETDASHVCLDRSTAWLPERSRHSTVAFI